MRLMKVLNRLKHYGLKLVKCRFFQTSFRYLGHVADAQGVHTHPDKTFALRNWPTVALTGCPSNLKPLMKMKSSSQRERIDVMKRRFTGAGDKMDGKVFSALCQRLLVIFEGDCHLELWRAGRAAKLWEVELLGETFSL